MKLKYLFCILLLSSILTLSAQESTSVKVNNLSFFNIEEELYKANMIALNLNQFNLAINFRIEDELVTQNKYSLKNEVTYIDLNFSYVLNKFDFTLSIENILNLNSSGFTIEPIINDNFGFIEAIKFSHESDFLISICVIFNF